MQFLKRICAIGCKMTNGNRALLLSETFVTEWPINLSCGQGSNISSENNDSDGQRWSEDAKLKMQERQLSGGMHEDQWFHSWANLRPYMKNRPRKVKHSLWSREFHIRLETYQAASQKFVKICSRFYYPFHLSMSSMQEISPYVVIISPSSSLCTVNLISPWVNNLKSFTISMQ